jgi:D-2-hydroxyacid dehydrogenase (NADP+)
VAEVDGNRTRRTRIARPNRFEGGGAHQAHGHLHIAPYRLTKVRHMSGAPSSSSDPATNPATRPLSAQGQVIFCTDTVAAVHAQTFTELLPDVEIIQLIEGVEISDADRDRITIAFFSGDAYPERSPQYLRVALKAPNLRWLHTFSAGVDSPIFQSLMAQGITVTNSSGASAAPIAQTVMMYLLALSRDLPAWFRAQQHSRWDQRRIADLEGMRLGIIGMGPIGCEVARLALAFGMRPIGMRRSVTGSEPCETWTLNRLMELVAQVDALVLAVPLSDSTRHLIDASVLNAMPKGSMLINVARGGVVDEEALITALRDGPLGSAALDVFATEPLPSESPLWAMENVIITPHSSGSTPSADERAVDVFITNLGRLAAGEALVNQAQLIGPS